MIRALGAVTAALALAPAAQAGGPSIAFGAAEDAVRAPTLVESEAAMGLLRLAGFRAVRVTSTWEPGLAAPTAHEAMVLANVAAAAALHGVRVYVSVYHAGSRTTPLTPAARAAFAAYVAEVVRANPTFRDVIVGNEPNLNRFWLPQFELDGSGASAPAYNELLAATYDAVKAAAPETLVWGGALAPRGVDKPFTGRDTISPTRFIREWGAAYAAGGRTAPVMDGFSFHPYGEHSSVPVDRVPADPDHLGLADQDKLVRLLGQAFDGTGQPGSGLPILYDEYGIESVVPPEKAALYEGTEPATTRPVDEAAQGAAYAQALRLASCQSNVAGILLFHVQDEPGLAGWQSGVLYPDGTPKSSLGVVRDTIGAIAGGTAGKCPLAVRPVVAFTPAARRISLRCDRDCVYRARLVRLPAGSVTAWRNGRAAPGRRVSFQLGARVAPGSYRLSVSFVHATRPAKPVVRVSRPFALRSLSRSRR
ncbi:MAG TPA: hypothetical protein VML35_06715 [Gaiellaceae bacterium]|nr:hypothetical protein [Gaiellaceae bacterium]